MKRTIVASLLGALILSLAADANAGRVVARKGPRGTRVTVHRSFPIRRTLPHVVVRPAPVVRIAPAVYLAPVVFTAAVVASLPPENTRVWTGAEGLDRDEGWTDFTMNVDRRGDRMVLEIDRGAAQISFAEVVFENGDAQVVDFNDRAHATGAYSLLNFSDGRKVDHVRVVAKATTRESVIRLYLIG
ncbi:MAG TPA: hypothetical protein VNA69_22020 [Thermoanaerobaculia bacterium]|nr:hypothetical protein [Thermoanaerobaculia bacterium]